MVTPFSTTYLVSHLDSRKGTGNGAADFFCSREKDEVYALLATTPEHGVALANITLPRLAATVAVTLFGQEGKIAFIVPSVVPSWRSRPTFEIHIRPDLDAVLASYN